MTVRVRIAPSPTGNLHIGTARTAVFNWLFAHNQKGKFILRIEDTDEARSRQEYTENIQSGLKWLGLNWDEGPFFQTQRLDRYQQAIQTLLDKDLAYRCYCTPEELEQMREEQKTKGLAPRYDNRHRNLTSEQIAAYEAEGRKPVIRFKIDDHREIVWHDLIRDEVRWKGSDLGGDMVVARAAEGDQAFGQPLYNLAVVVDDIDMEITHVIRGEDHIANTAKQILLYEAMGVKVPEFAHTPLILNQDGRKLSKRDGVTSIDDFRKMGFLPEAMANYMSLLGWTPPDSTEEIFTLSQAAEQFSLDRVNKAGAKFDWAKLDWINSQYLHQMPPDKLVELLVPYWQEGGYEINLDTDHPWLESLTAMIAPSLTRLTDAVKESKLLFGESVEYSQEALDFLKQDEVKPLLQELLETINFTNALSEAEAKNIVNQLTKTHKVKKGLVMRSLRAGLTGELHGPDLIQSWLLLNQKGLDRIRLQQTLSKI
ncbi:glutamyl-tRNA synthetase [Stanieria cyanosphaera PCC 7437]|uniref:Glutamate--tRNA ligase n=1 Tax=Stanieria cyanosphaera (strain ATCC 29371 / PCC 7437) TaxID=111780 RepID=K9XP94_STAC7|nr:glutamate--tRNA ligase [Stanieria cyanosphaera]AFZ34435.1 glutamyl-tRNA synthetase [Stanieria cyanosphaera PCC 7437]